MTYREEAPEPPKPPTVWGLLVRTTFFLEGGKMGACNSVVRSTIPESDPAPRGVSVSVLNGVRRSVAADNKIDVGRVMIDWYEVVLCDEEIEG